MAEVLSRAIDLWFPRERREREAIRIIAEPGRYFVAEAFQLATNIIARRVSPKSAGTEETEKNMELDSVLSSPISLAATAIEDAPTADSQPSMMCTSCSSVFLRSEAHIHTFLRLHQRRRLWRVQLHHVRSPESDPLPSHPWPLVRVVVIVVDCCWLRTPCRPFERVGTHVRLDRLCRAAVHAPHRPGCGRLARL
jgi:hypothetical protein